jgi:MFS family permease
MLQDNLTAASTGDFDWISQEQGVILGAYFYGNIAVQILGGILAEKAGGKWVFGLGIFLGSVGSLLTPVAAKAGIGYIVAARAILGMGQVGHFCIT